MGLNPDALYSAVFDDVKVHLHLGPVGPSKLPPDATYKQFVSTSLLYDVVRKWTPLDTSLADAAAKGKFLTANKTCRDWNLRIEGSWDDQLIGELRREIDIFLHPLGEPLFSSYFDFLKYGRTGPGAALGARGNSLYAKLFSSKLTVTSQNLYDIYKSYIKWFHNFEDADRQRYEKYGDYDVRTSSRCSFVPKTKDVSRMICVEPSVNMFCQLGLGAMLEDRLASLFDIDLATQPSRNRQLAYIGSRDGSFATIDLSSASDSISLRLCEMLFPSWFFKTLLELRSPSTLVDGVRVPLFMMSTMGNGFTFPLQTVMFSCLIRAAYRVAGYPVLDGQRMNWACFGDDLIVETRVYRYLIRLLSLCGFSVNVSKTFHEGPFRESCGTDWFFGQPARSIYIRKLRSQQDIFVAINLLNGWSAYTGVPLKRTIKYLRAGLNRLNKICFVPFHENNDSGIRVPSIIGRQIFKYDPNKSILYRCYRAAPVKISIGEGNIRFPRGVKNLMYNPPGLYVSFLYGELVACSGDIGESRYHPSIMIRHDLKLYKRKLQCSPFWDYIPTDNLTNGYKLSWRQWETAVGINLPNP